MPVMIDRLQQLLDPQAVQGALALPTEQQVDQALQQTEQVVTQLAPADLSDEVVQRFAGRYSGQSVGPLLDLAAALRDHPELVAATEVTPEEAEKVARLMIAAGGLQTAMATLHEGVDAAALLATHALDVAVEATLKLAEAVPAGSPHALVVRCLFSEPARQRQALEAPAAAPAASEPPPQLVQRQRLDDLLDDVKHDRLALPALRAVAAAAP